MEATELIALGAAELIVQEAAEVIVAIGAQEAAKVIAIAAQQWTQNGPEEDTSAAVCRSGSEARRRPN